MKKNVYVTGGSGFLGRQIVRHAGRKHNVFKAPSSQCNLLDLDSVVKYLEEKKAEGTPIEVIVNSAAYYGGLNITMSEPATIFYKNIQMINNVFATAAQTGVKKIVVVGSACAYPGGVEGDMSESDFWSGPLHGSVEGYGFTKKIQLVAQRVYCAQYGIEAAHLVLTNLYGPNDVFTEYRGHAIAVLIRRYVEAALQGKAEVVNWGDGSPIREFLYVEDAAKVIAHFIDTPHDLEPVNVGTGTGTSIKQLAELIAEYAGYKGRVVWDTSKPTGAMRKVLDVGKLRRLMPDFTPLPLDEGLKRTIQWYKQNKAEADKRK